MYGVHGIDDNPKSRPFADTGMFCGDCGADADCGEGGRCMGMDGGAMCTFECTADSACGSGNICQQTESNGWVRDRFCVPDQFACN